MSIKVKDLLPLIWYNDIRLVVGANEEICLIRKDFNKKILSDGEDEMGIKNDCRRNAEGYSDPTVYEALKNMEQEEERFHKLLDTIFALCELSDFHIEERIVIKDKRTGRIWR